MVHLIKQIQMDLDKSKLKFILHLLQEARNAGKWTPVEVRGYHNNG